VSTIDKHVIYTNLRGDKCACGDPKLPDKSLCRRDYFRLPKAMRNALYQRDGYVDAFRAALKFLDLDLSVAVAAAKAEASRRALTNGPRARNPRLFNGR
jgi:hypothetical protein